MDKESRPLSEKVYCNCGKDLDNEQCKLGYPKEDVKKHISNAQERLKEVLITPIECATIDTIFKQEFGDDLVK